MSLITRCPACGTQFRVVPDQLKISDGWVRCGQCSEVFDAQASLVGAGLAPVVAPATEDAPVPTQADGFAYAAADDEPEPEYEPPPLHPVPDALPGPAADAAPEPDLQWTTALEPAVAAEPMPAIEPALGAQPIPSEASEPIEPVLDPIPEPATEPRSVTAPEGTEAEPQSGNDPVSASDPEPAPALEDVSFVRHARRRAFWQRPMVRVVLVLLALLLGLLLAGQVAIHQRDLLAQKAPGLRPALEALCQPLGCRVGPPRRIEAVVIDHSTFSRLRPDAYRLAVTLANQSTTAVSMPALELTLTDSQDQPVLRRVIAPAELGQGAAGVIGANAEWTANLTVAVTPSATTARIVGYRLLAFYP